MKLAARVLSGVAVAVIAAALFVGCGGSDDSTESIATSDLTKVQWIKRAGPICTKGNVPVLSELVAYQEKHPAKTERESEAVTGKALRAVVPPAISKEVEKIRALGAPSGDEQQIEEFLEAMEADIKSVEEGALLSSAAELDKKFRRSGQLARQYGLEECAFG